MRCLAHAYKKKGDNEAYIVIPLILFICEKSIKVMCLAINVLKTGSGLWHHATHIFCALYIVDLWSSGRLFSREP
jgi:hypothetical protein